MPSAKDIMTKDVITVSPEMEILHAAQLLLEKRVNGEVDAIEVHVMWAWTKFM